MLPWNFFVLSFRHVPQHLFKKKLSHQIQCWLHINCGRTHVWENPWKVQIFQGVGNVLLIKIKIKCPTGQIFVNPFKKLQHLMFLFLMSIIWDNQLPLHDYSTFFPHIHLYPHSFQKNWHDHKKCWRFHQIPLHYSGGEWCHENRSSLTPHWILRRRLQY